MEEQSPYLMAKQLELSVNSLLSVLDLLDLPQEQQRAIAGLKRGLTDARLEIQDYELAETRDDQLRNAANARQCLSATKSVVVDGTISVFGAADVAQLAATIEHIASKLR